MSGYTQTKLPQVQVLERDNSPRQHITIDIPEPTYQQPSQRSPVLGTALQDIDLERGNGFEPLTMNEAKLAPKKKRYIFGIPDNPFEDSESDNEWMRHIDEDEAKPETNNFQQASEQRRIICCHNTSGLTRKRSSVSCTELSIVIVIMVVAGLIILLPNLLGRAK
ncbi:unnamed protein product [Aspergillus oryzae RIB40]|uniref:DNA, SC023 n=1 Tax=Aspergillus oryzae (strain ATCC 42149 / RIB 40) TaxID=510516 RepID=Q2UI59_ASPOR|nr:unnamed protein product [Aspergillus oryzae RIB40]KAJ1709650.1 hypothetical protein NYO67_8192 [Aspergillus flavus]RAQ41900.1 hypothetical protein AFGD_000967 [Aspergillus flavus]BAE58756.1 unnamed protein product [Aspergillus oryzae RIB40]